MHYHGRGWQWALAIAILLLAATTRLSAPGITEFKRDEANLSLLALDVARGRALPLVGLPSSTGFPNTPISAYLFAIPYLLGANPIPATLFVGFLNVIAVALTWRLARRYWGAVAASVAALLYAASPWAAIYSRKIWAQDLLPPFVLATVLTGLLGFREEKRWARRAHWPLLALTVQVHYGGVSLLPLSALMLLVWQRRLSKDMLAGLGLAMLTIIPALAGAYQLGLFSVEGFSRLLSASQGGGAVIDGTALKFAWLTVAGTQIHSLAGPEQFRAYLASVLNAYPLFNLVSVAVVISAIWLVWRMLRRRGKQRSPDGMLVAWLLMPILVFTWQWAAVQPHYMIPLMPAAYIVVGAGFAGLRRAIKAPRARQAARHAMRAGTGLLLAVIVGLQVYMFGGLLRFLDTTYTPGGFGTPLSYLLDVREAILEREAQDVLVVSAGNELAAFAQEPAVWSALLDGEKDVRFVDGTRTLVVPQDDSLELVRLSDQLATSPAADYWVSRADARIFAQRPGDDKYLLRSGGLFEAEQEILVLEPVRFANGAMLVGYAVDARGVLTMWRLDGPVPEDYQTFVHAIDADGQRPGQADRLSWPGRYWRAGDTLYLWYEVTPPPQSTVLRVGMYTVDGEVYNNVEVLDLAGAYVGQWAEIDLE